MKTLNIITGILSIIAFIAIIALHIYEIYRSKKMYDEMSFKVKDLKRKLKDIDGNE